MKRPAKQSQNAKREKLVTSFLRNSEMANTINVHWFAETAYEVNNSRYA